MQIRQIVRVSDQGVSRPYQCYDENGVLRWCKGNHTGLRSLIAEWVCARIARELELPVPACDILRLDPAFDRETFLHEHALRRFLAAAGPTVADAFAARVRQVVTESLLDEIWSEMPAEWTETGCETLPLETMKGVLLGREFQ